MLNGSAAVMHVDVERKLLRTRFPRPPAMLGLSSRMLAKPMQRVDIGKRGKVEGRRTEQPQGRWIMSAIHKLPTAYASVVVIRTCDILSSRLVSR
jgi:hypothetical protein